MENVISLTLHDNYDMCAQRRKFMADRVKLIERIAARGRRKLEKRNERLARQEAEDRARRDAEIAAIDAILARRAERRAKTAERQKRAALRGPPTTEQILAKQARRAKRAERKAYRAFLARERTERNAALEAKRPVKCTPAPRKELTPEEFAAKREALFAEIDMIFAKQRLPPLPY